MRCKRASACSRRDHAKSGALALHPFDYVLLPVRESVVERHLAHLIGTVEVGPPNDELHHGRQVARSCRHHERCLLFVHGIAKVGLSAVLEQEPDGLIIARTSHHHERRPAHGVGCFCLGSVLEQHLQHF